jgi:uracil phosphoribosyltransferase
MQSSINSDIHTPHNYGPQVTILKDTYLLTLLEQLSSPKCVQPVLTEYMRQAYVTLLTHALNLYAPQIQINTKTRMHDQHPEAAYLQHNAFNLNSSMVTVNIARAGTVPSQVCYDLLNLLFSPEKVRQDHFYLNRQVNEAGQVVGVDGSGSKVGGNIDDSTVIIPDPMGATGGTICHAAEYYKNEIKGNAKKYIALHLIVTPEYIQKVTEEHPDICIVAARLDRGLSSPKAMDSIPGTHLSEEKGLNKFQYIVPGAGGMGELMNNAVD